MFVRDKKVRETDQVIHRERKGYDDFMRWGREDVDDGDLEL